MPQDFIQSLLLVSAVSADALVSSFAYGAKKIKIPFLSVVIIVGIGSLFLLLSIFAGELIRPFLSETAAKSIGFFILFFLGIVKLLDNVLKTIIKSRNKLDKQIKFKLLSLNFILNIYANPEDADQDKSQILSPKESAALAVALSLDGLAVGAGTALVGVNIPMIVVLSLVIGFLAVNIGCRLGNKAAGKMKFDFSWLGGGALIALAALKLL